MSQYKPLLAVAHEDTNSVAYTTLATLSHTSVLLMLKLACEVTIGQCMRELIAFSLIRVRYSEALVETNNVSF